MEEEFKAELARFIERTAERAEHEAEGRRLLNSEQALAVKSCAEALLHSIGMMQLIHKVMYDREQ